MAGSTWLSTISTGRVNKFETSSPLTKSDSAFRFVQRPSIITSVSVCLSSSNHIVSGSARLTSIEQVDRSGLPFPELFDQGDALLKLRTTLLELLHLHE